MATDASLVRLRDLLQLVCGCCDESSAAIWPILGTILLQARIDEWWKENSGDIRNALGYGAKAESAMSIAATLCATKQLDGDANELRKAQVALNQKRTDILSFYHSSNLPAEPQEKAQAIEQRTAQAELWTALLCCVSAGYNASWSLLNTLEGIVEVERQPGEQRDSAEQTRPASQVPSDFIKLGDVARLLGHSTKKRVQNAAVEWRKAGHDIKDPCSYATIRPLVLSTWKNKEELFDADVAVVQRILKNLG